MHGAIVFLLAAPAFARALEPTIPAPLAGIGYEVSGLGGATSPGAIPLKDSTSSDANPLYLRLEILWAEVEKAKGQFDWAEADGIVDQFRASHHEVIVDLWGGNPLYGEDILRSPTASDAAGFEAWTQFARAAAVHFKGRVRYFQIGKTPNAAPMWQGADPAKSYAFLLKKTAVIVRAEVKGAAIVMGGMAGPDVAWIEKLYAEGAAPYLDVVSFRPEARTDLGAQCDAVQAAILAHDASAKLWVESVPAAGSGQDAGGEIIRKILTSLDHGASLVSFALRFDQGGTATAGEFLVRAHSVLAQGLGRVPSADRLSFGEAGGGDAPSDLRTISFFDHEKGLSVIGLWTEHPGSPMALPLRLLARRPGPPTLYDPVVGQESHPVFEAVQGGAQGTITVGHAPVFLLYREGMGGAIVPEGSESLEVSAKRGMTAEEVIAKYREFQAAEDARLSHYRSDAMINFHFRLAGYSQTIDVGMAGSYFFDTKGGAEWELRDYYLNGNKSRWKDFPELPLIQPEKVVTLPLDITFDRSYQYEYAGEDTIAGRLCHVLTFEPFDPEKTLYRGRLWIDSTSWARVRVASIQTKLDPPFLSNEERTTFEPVKGPDGAEHWVITRIDGQQIYSASGRNFIVLRDILFTNHKINDPEFAAAHETAYKSNHQILRDTDKGFRYLEKTETGERRVKEAVNSNQFFGLAGILYDPSLTHPIPLLGVNYFDYDFKGTGIQSNLFFAGVLLTLNATDPDLGGSGLDVGVDLALNALKTSDRDYSGGDEVKSRGVKNRHQSIAFNMGREIGDFVKLRTQYEIQYQAYDTDDDTASSFILPKDTLIQTAGLDGTFNRAGYEVRASASFSARRRFEFWGRSGGQDFNPKAEGYARYQAGTTKEFFLPAFQKLRFAADVYGSSDLDRFSRYSFNRFAERVRGFSGSGVRFDSGAIARGAYLFNIAEVIRLEAAIDYARVRTKGFEGEATSHTGLGIAANVLGPWKTVWQLDYGYALQSDIRAVRGNQELLLVVLKLF